MKKITELPREILEMIFWRIDCPLTAHRFFEQVLVGERSLSTQCEFFRFVMTSGKYKSFKRLEYLRQDLPDDVFMYKLCQRSLLSPKPNSTLTPLLLTRKFGKLGLTD